MQEFERLDLAFKDAGAGAETIIEIIRHGEVAWELLVSGDVEFFVRYDDPHQMLVFTADVGTPETSQRLPVYTALLQFNQMHAETGGAMMAVDDSGQIELVFRLNTANAEPFLLQHVVENLAQKVLLWRTVLRGEPSDTDAAAPGVIDARMMV